MRVPSLIMLLVALVAMSAQAGCKSAAAGAFQCINDGDCPPGCSCDSDFVAVGVCESDETANECGGSCDRESTCPEGSECVLSGVDGSVEIYSCQASMLGDLGDSCVSNNQCDPNASSLGAFCCLDAAQCGPNLNQCVEDCSEFSSEGIVQEFEGAECQNNTECAASLFCCLVPDAAGNCDFGQDQSCTCRTPTGSME